MALWIHFQHMLLAGSFLCHDRAQEFWPSTRMVITRPSTLLHHKARNSACSVGQVKNAARMTEFCKR